MPLNGNRQTPILDHNELVVRRATRSDLPQIIQLLADDELGQQREKPTLPLAQAYCDAYSAIDADPNQLLIVGEYELKAVACLQLSFIPGLSRLGLWRGQIESVRVSTKVRNKGFGAELLAWAMTECRQRQCGLVQLSTDKSRPNAKRFYESLGFVASHEGMKLAL